MIQLLDKFKVEEISLSDAWSLCNFMVANEGRFMRYFPKTLEQNLTPTLSKIFVQKKVTQFCNKEEFLFTIKENESTTIIGLVYIKELDWKKKQGEFAYCIGYQYENKRITSTAIKVLSAYAFNNLDLEILQIIVHKNNTGSVKVVDSNGFIWKKTLLKSFTPPGEIPLDMELYELYK